MTNPAGEKKNNEAVEKTREAERNSKSRNRRGAESNQKEDEKTEDRRSIKKKKKYFLFNCFVLLSFDSGVLASGYLFDQLCDFPLVSLPWPSRIK